MSNEQSSSNPNLDNEDHPLNLKLPEVYILKALQNGRQLFGMEIKLCIEQSCNYKMNFSSLYPKLTVLELKGLIVSTENNIPNPTRSSRRKFFKISAKGKKAIDEWELAYLSISQTVIPAPQGA